MSLILASKTGIGNVTRCRMRHSVAGGLCHCEGAVATAAICWTGVNPVFHFISYRLRSPYEAKRNTGTGDPRPCNDVGGGRLAPLFEVIRPFVTTEFIVVILVFYGCLQTMTVDTKAALRSPVAQETVEHRAVLIFCGSSRLGRGLR